MSRALERTTVEKRPATDRDRATPDQNAEELRESVIAFTQSRAVRAAPACDDTEFTAITVWVVSDLLEHAIDLPRMVLTSVLTSPSSSECELDGCPSAEAVVVSSLRARA